MLLMKIFINKAVAVKEDDFYAEPYLNFKRILLLKIKSKTSASGGPQCV